MAKQEPVVGLVFFPAFDWCITPDHPERQERLLYTRDQIQEEGLFDHPRIQEFRPRLAAPGGDSAHPCGAAKPRAEHHRIPPYRCGGEPWWPRIWW